MSSANPSAPGLLFRRFLRFEGFSAPRFLLLGLGFTLAAVAADQFAAPILHSTSPLWATTACLLLVCRRGKPLLAPEALPPEVSIPISRLTTFVAAHGALILLARLLSGTLQSASGASTVWGTLLAAAKLSVLAPTIILFPFVLWKKTARIYFPEAVAALVVLLTFFPRRALHSAWPLYGQVLARLVYTLARLFVPSLAYLADLNPTLEGPYLDVTIVPDCSGIQGLELFDYLFGAVVVLDWNRLRKGRALLAYFVGLLAMLLGNTIRITSLVVLGNHGFAALVSRLHISAGWMFFSAVFLIYLSLTYRWILGERVAAEERSQFA